MKARMAALPFALSLFLPFGGWLLQLCRMAFYGCLLYKRQHRNTVPPAKMTAESAKRGLFTPSWHDSESSIPTMPTSMTMPDMTKYDVEPNHRQASMNSRMSRNQMEVSIQSRALLLFIAHRF